MEISCQIESLATNPYRKELDILGISLKVGLAGERKYIVKNIYRFLQIYQDEKMYNGIKQGNVYLHPDAFTLEENELLHHLSNNAQTQQLLGHTGVQVNGSLDKKYLLLPVSEGRELLEKMQKIPFVFVADEKKYTKLNFSEQP